jgi:hypothetical protein
MNTELVYAVYLLITCALTIWVAQTLHRNGQIFLIDAFHGNDMMANAVNHLLRVGFYLINLGFVALFLRTGNKPESLVEAVEYIASKVGFVMLVLGGMHFFNMFNIARMRRKAKAHEAGASKHEAAELAPPESMLKQAQSLGLTGNDGR